jgi:hypothetical protein
MYSSFVPIYPSNLKAIKKNFFFENNLTVAGFDSKSLRKESIFEIKINNRQFIL